MESLTILLPSPRWGAAAASVSRRFVLGAVLVYQLTLLRRHEHGPTFESTAKPS